MSNEKEFIKYNVENFDDIDGITSTELCQNNIRKAKKKIKETQDFKLKIDETQITDLNLFMKNVLDLFNYYKEKVTENSQDGKTFAYIKQEAVSEELKTFLKVVFIKDINEKNER